MAAIKTKGAYARELALVSLDRKAYKQLSGQLIRVLSEYHIDKADEFKLMFEAVEKK